MRLATSRFRGDSGGHQGLGVRDLLELSKAIGPSYSANLTVVVDIVDDVWETALPLLNTGLGIGADGSPYRTWGDSSLQRYLVNGGIQIGPHDHCPDCLVIWDFKFPNHSCEHCGITLGKECKVLLDTDVCPHCEEGKVSLQKPGCNKCGYQIDLNMVAWDSQMSPSFSNSPASR